MYMEGSYIHVDGKCRLIKYELADERNKHMRVTTAAQSGGGKHEL